MQIDGVCFKHGENSETGMSRKKPKIKMVYNLFAGDKWRNLYFYMKNDMSTIMQIMSMIWVKSTLIAMESSDSIIHSSKYGFELNRSKSSSFFLKLISKLTFI